MTLDDIIMIGAFFLFVVLPMTILSVALEEHKNGKK